MPGPGTPPAALPLRAECPRPWRAGTRRRRQRPAGESLELRSGSPIRDRRPPIRRLSSSSSPPTNREGSLARPMRIAEGSQPPSDSLRALGPPSLRRLPIGVG